MRLMSWMDVKKFSVDYFNKKQLTISCYQMHQVRTVIDAFKLQTTLFRTRFFFPTPFSDVQMILSAAVS